jgi:hypothetical protein
LDLQALAIKRGVTIRRIFILEKLSLAELPELRQICDDQCAKGVDVRLIDAETAAAVASRHVPLVLFDRAISLELTPSRFHTAAPGFVKTTLVLNPFQVHERLEMFERLWIGGTKVDRGSH